MKRILFFALLLSLLPLCSLAQPYKIPSDAKKILFIGNSISYQGKYIEFIDAYFTFFYPDKKYEFINLGLPSETVSQLSEPGHANGRFPRPALQERLQRVLEKTNPDLVFSCYGMNDGIYMPFDEKRFKKFKKGIVWLDKKVRATGARIIHITPPDYDERQGGAYSNVLDIYAAWLLSKRYTTNWSVIDIHFPMKAALRQQRAVDPDFAFSKDGIHPNEKGHFLMAREILLQLGESKVKSYTDAASFLADRPKGPAILKLVQQRQRLLKDAWLSHTGHKRPNMKEGLPMEEALLEAKEIEKAIHLSRSGSGSYR